jgi:hypothetical protein
LYSICPTNHFINTRHLYLYSICPTNLPIIYIYILIYFLYYFLITLHYNLINYLHFLFITLHTPAILITSPTSSLYS